MKVRYLFKCENQSSDMTVGNIYEVIGIEADFYRILNDENSPYLYDPKQFEIVESSEPEFWVNEYGDDGERYSYPETWSQPGFFEDFLDNLNQAREEFWKVYKKYYLSG